MTAHLVGKNVEESACHMWNATTNSLRRLSQPTQACMAMRDKSNKILTSFHETSCYDMCYRFVFVERTVGALG